jgi:hypothetical protein
MRQVLRIIPPLLCFVAGYVDSCTFVALFGLFVAQVTGSLVLAGTQLIVLKPAALLRFVEIFAFFLAGVATTFGQKCRRAGTKHLDTGACARRSAAFRPVNFMDCEWTMGAQYVDCHFREPTGSFRDGRPECIWLCF